MKSRSSTLREGERIPFRVHPMLATLVGKPFHRAAWVYEEKYDGYRILAYKEGANVTLLSRNAEDPSRSFPAIAKAIGQLRPRTLLLDGEAVAFDWNHVSRFQLLQQGGVLVVYAAFDCLYRAGRDLRNAPLRERRLALEGALRGAGGRLILSRRLARDGLEAYRLAQRMGFEGLVAKDDASVYEERRSRRWLKVKVHQQEEFVIGGYTRPAGSRAYVGALLVGAYAHGTLHYVGKVGTGFTAQTLSSLWSRFQPLARTANPFANPPREQGVKWLAPCLVAQVAFQEWTAGRRLRQPSFLGLRDDKKPEECVLPGEAA